MHFVYFLSKIMYVMYDFKSFSNFFFFFTRSHCFEANCVVLQQLSWLDLYLQPIILFVLHVSRWAEKSGQLNRGANPPPRKANPRMACQSVTAVMDEQALLGLNPNADARYRQRVRTVDELWSSNNSSAGSVLMGWCKQWPPIGNFSAYNLFI